MGDRWTCRAQRHLVKWFPNAGMNVKLPRWAWRLLCSNDCTDACLTTCAGCRELAGSEWKGILPAEDEPAVRPLEVVSPADVGCVGEGCCGAFAEAPPARAAAADDDIEIRR